MASPIGAPAVPTAAPASAAAAAGAAEPKEVPRELAQWDEVAEEPARAQEMHAALKALAQQGPVTAELLWRLSRAAFKVSDLPAESKRRGELVTEALGHARNAVAMDEKCAAAHRWLGLSLNANGEIQGSKVKIGSLLDIRAAWDRAVELDPTDATSFNLLGRWCFGVLNVSWMERKLANALFGKLPEASLDEAYDYFRRAEEAKPGFYKNNRLMLAKCLQQMGRKAEAKHWLEQALKLPQVSEEDKRDHAAAAQLLRDM